MASPTLKGIEYGLKWLFKPGNIAAFYKLANSKSSYLVQQGWAESRNARHPMDKSGNPLPWNSYPYIHFILERLPKESRVFEYGAGFSTLFYQTHAASVTSVEHDRFWYERLLPQVGPNVSLNYCELQAGGEYCKFAQQSGKRYDMIIVDGRDRVNCVKESIGALSEKGVIVLDDSERERYAEAKTFLADKGFKRIAFIGLKPGAYTLGETTVFYRQNNIFGL